MLTDHKKVVNGNVSGNAASVLKHTFHFPEMQEAEGETGSIMTGGELFFKKYLLFDEVTI